ncbi:MAG: hypothetical protein ACRBEQ_13195 [Hyphomonas sp.]
MLNFLTNRRANRDPLTITANLEVEADLDRVFDLLDFNAPRNALRERGFKFVQAPGQEDQHEFHAEDPAIEDLKFDFCVDTYLPQRELAFSTFIQSDTIPLGDLVKHHSHYVLKPLGENRCHLELTETAHVRDGLSNRKYQKELAALIYSVERHLVRLSVHAVKGAEAAELV